MIASDEAAMNAQLKPCTPRAMTSIALVCAAPPAERGQREQDQRGDEHPALPELVGRPAAEHQEAGERDRVGVDDPLQLGRARS